MKRIENDTPISIYDCDKKSLIGIFKFQWIVTRYLNVRDGVVYKSVNRRGSKILKSDLGRVALRYATKEQVELLNGESVFIVDDSRKKFDPQILMKFHTTRLDLYVDHTLRPFGKKLK